jgi:putative membrane protein
MSTAPASTRSGAHDFEVRVTSDSHFAWLRTRMALERTLMAWLRTAVSMIGFGFTIVQFFERMASMEGVKAAVNPEAPRYLGLALIAGGTLALLLSTWQYHTLVNYLWSDPYQPITTDKHTRTPALAVSIVMIFIGLFAFVAVLTRLG